MTAVVRLCCLALLLGALPVRAAAVRAAVRLCTATASPAVARAHRVKVAHILVDTEGMAETVMSALEEGSSSFEEMAETVSTCDSKGRGGDLGWITPGLMDPAFDAAAFMFPPGEVVTVQSTFGWHVLRVAEASYLPAEMEPCELKERLECGDADDGADGEDDGRLLLVDLRDDAEVCAPQRCRRDAQRGLPPPPRRLGSAPWLTLRLRFDARARAARRFQREQAVIQAPFRHLPYNQWMTWADDAIAGKLEPPLPRSAEIVFMDHRGGRAERLMQYFAQQGFVGARWLRGGINSYAEEADPSVPVYLESEGDCLTCHEH